MNWELFKMYMPAFLFLVCVIAITYTYEYYRFKNSTYGKQNKNKFIRILFNRGARGEYKTSLVLEKADFEKKLLFNCYIPTEKGDKTEVDIIVVSVKGVYVIENKNYSGWIFGDEKSKKWCEMMGKKKYFFFNPIMQNKGHITNMENLLQIGKDKYTSVITFNQNANLKKINVTSEKTHVIGYFELGKFVQKQKDMQSCLDSEKIEQIYNALLPGTQLTYEEKQQHIERINAQFKKKK